MPQLGSEQAPLRVAVVGSGPAGFYTIHALFNRKELNVRVDMFERLVAPFGLVRHGVAPDHPKMKSVTAAYHKLATAPAFRFFGGVEYGRDVTLDDLRRHYHQIVFCTGAQTDRRLGIAGEDLAGSHPATEFVAWYNGHPDFRDLEFNLDAECAVVIGVGNVAVDVARILCRTRDELATTDIADHALEALSKSRVREVYLVGRRGPVQAAFTNTEVKELGALVGANVATLPEEMELDPISREALESDRTAQKKVEILRGFAEPPASPKDKQLTLRFLASPVEIVGNAEGEVSAIRLVRNELYQSDDGAVRSRATDAHETLDTGLVFRSVGYRGVPLPELPFRDDWGVLPNEQGCIVDTETREPLLGLYCAGWIKRGPSGVIGTNKKDAFETVTGMLEDLQNGRLLEPEFPQLESIEALLRSRNAEFVSYEEWETLDALEVEQGASQGRPRVKFTRHDDFDRALGR